MTEVQEQVQKLDSWRDMLPLAKSLYLTDSVGGPLHIVLDDGNLETGHVVFSLNCARRDGHAVAIELARMLLRASFTQRTKLYRNRDLYNNYCSDIEAAFAAIGGARDD